MNPWGRETIGREIDFVRPHRPESASAWRDVVAWLAFFAAFAAFWYLFFSRA